MSKHDYTKHSKTQEPEVKSEETKVTEDPITTPVTPAPTVETEENDTIIGIVVECAKLNVRKEPAADAEILTTIPKGSEVQVDIFESTEDFYKVCTGAGVEGYCVKDYINID